ncbi:hypothetical protein BDR03DRAFT_986441 [Suillus americanus]|nr:hypothetical protein BDR03DRAFT_986441 [Suillus americanus]
MSTQKKTYIQQLAAGPLTYLWDARSGSIFTLLTAQMLCALGSDGQLNDASAIDWYNDPDDETPMLPPPLPPASNGKLTAFDFSDDEEETKDNDKEEAYERTKVFGDKDHEDHKHQKKEEHSGDLKMHDRVIPPNCKATNKVQKTLDASLTPKIPEFTKTSLMDYIVELIVSEDQGYPPLHQDLQQDSRMGQACCLAHQGEAQWELKSDQLTFTTINGNHSGSNIGRILIKAIDDYGIRNKTIANDIDPSGTKWVTGEHRMRCMEHALHLAAKHFIEDVAPTPASILNKNMTDNDDNDNKTTEFEVADTVG